MMGWPQIIMLLLIGISVGCGLAVHGRERPPFDFRVTFGNAVLTLGLLYWGGFFS